MVTRLAVLGSTGSIGRSTLEVVDAHPERLRVVALAAGRNAALLHEQTVRYRPALVSLDDGAALDGREASVECLTGAEGLRAVALHPDADIVVIATTGHAAIEPTLAALKAGKIVALANKETIVCAGELVMRAAGGAAGDRLRPVDSEHSALWQCLAASRPGAEAERLVLTASGGPFRTMPLDEMRRMKAADALRHPTWAMGTKITVDSATLMNKGLEMIEAHWLFAMPYERIDVIVNPQSAMHSSITYADGSVIAQLGPADMRLPIQYALSYPERWPNPFRRLDLLAIGHLDFALPDIDRFPALRLARQAGEAGNTYPTVLSAADEIAVERFLRDEIGFLDIAALVGDALDAHIPDGPLTLESIRVADRWAREFVADAR